jgi:hypothetical protein
MNKSIIKKALLLGAVGGLVVLGFHAQKYIRLFMTLRRGDETPASPAEEAKRDQQLDELLKTGDAVKVRISSATDEDEEYDEE